MNPNRRHLLKSGAAATLAAGVPQILKAQNMPDQIKVGLIGCGGRGTGAAFQALKADPGVVLWSVGDAFPEAIKRVVAQTKPFGKRAELPEERQHIGLDAYQKVIDSGVDVVLLATPPHFRPLHLRATVEAGKHAFVEKPMAVDITGVRSILESTKLAKEKNIAIQHGYCWRYHPGTREAYQKVLGGELGRVTSVYGTYMANPVKPLAQNGIKPDGMSDVEWQVRNWFNFEWLGAGPLVEQCIHTVDKIAWAMNDVDPIAVVATGGRAQKTDASNIYDHYNVAFEYPGGVVAHVGQRQFKGCHVEVRDKVFCENGVMTAPGRCAIADPKGKILWRSKPEKGVEQDMYQTCHNEFFAALRAGNIINTGEYMAKSTALGIFGREAAHSGQRLIWKIFWETTQDLAPDTLTLDDDFPMSPPPVPGQHKVS